MGLVRPVIDSDRVFHVYKEWVMFLSKAGKLCLYRLLYVGIKEYTSPKFPIPDMCQLYHALV